MSCNSMKKKELDLQNAGCTSCVEILQEIFQ